MRIGWELAPPDAATYMLIGGWCGFVAYMVLRNLFGFLWLRTKRKQRGRR